MKAAVFAARTAGVNGLRKLLDHGIEVLKVYAEPVPLGGEDYFDSPGIFCRKQGLDVVPCSEDDLSAVTREIRELAPDIGFAFDYSSILNQSVVDHPEHGFYFLHLSLLPDYQGPWPVNRAIMGDERKTGVTLFRAGNDPLKAEKAAGGRVWIAKDDTALTLYNKLADHGTALLEEHLPYIKEGVLKLQPLDLEVESYCKNLEDVSRINWLSRSFEVYNKVRALTRPFCGALTRLDGEDMLVWKAVPDDTAPGLLSAGELDADEGKLYVGTREGTVRLVEIEWKGESLVEPRIAEVVGPYWGRKFE